MGSRAKTITEEGTVKYGNWSYYRREICIYRFVGKIDAEERRRGTTNSYQLLFNSNFHYRSGSRSR